MEAWSAFFWEFPAQDTVHYISLLSGYKGNRINWLPESSKSHSVSDA